MRSAPTRTISKRTELKTHQSHWWGSAVFGVRVIVSASNSCSADFCPLETDLCPVNMLLQASQFRLELWSQRWEANVSSTKPFSLFLWRKIDFKKAINLQWFISSDHLHFLLLIIRLYCYIVFILQLIQWDYLKGKYMKNIKKAEIVENYQQHWNENVNRKNKRNRANVIADLRYNQVRHMVLCNPGLQKNFLRVALILCPYTMLMT